MCRSPLMPYLHPQRRRLSWSALLLSAPLGALACEAPDPLTQIEVTIDGDAEVLASLHRVKASVYETDRTQTAPTDAHVFALPTSMNGTSPPAEPFSFGVVRGKFDQFALVVEGYGADPSTPIIERKVFVRFTPAQTRALSIHLTADCLHLINPCRRLDHTCRPGVRACIPVEEAETTALGASPDQPTGKVDPSCEQAECNPDYPCAATDGGRYTCRGRFAEWPMPDRAPGAKFAPRYDVSTTPGLVRDTVTGLIWQRDLPDQFAGCTGKAPNAAATGTTCTWDEAKLYCSALSIDGRRFRLPSKIELESIVDLTVPRPPFDALTFPGKDWNIFWTSSPDRGSRNESPARVWTITYPGVTDSIAADLTAIPRCVSGEPAGTTPSERYIAEADVIHDRQTTLYWAREVSPPLDSEEAAARYCQERSNGFRLPTHKELLTLVDPTRFYPATSPIFSEAPLGTFWSASPPQQALAWRLIIDFDRGASLVAASSFVGPVRKEGPRARCVR